MGGVLSVNPNEYDDFIIAVRSKRFSTEIEARVRAPLTSLDRINDDADTCRWFRGF